MKESTEIERELQKTLTEINQKHIYFLLAAAGACIGFAITQTGKDALSWWFTPLAFGLISWGMSFICGYLCIGHLAKMTNANIFLLAARHGRFLAPGQNRAAAQEHVDNFTDAYCIHSAKSSSFRKWQFFLFVFGVIAFIAWHILEMWRRIPENMCLWV